SPGRLGGGSGRPGKTGPRPPGGGAVACGLEVIRQPRDFPPATSGSPGAALAAAATDERTVASSTPGGSGRRACASTYGNWYRKVAIPRPARARATDARKG